MDVCDCEMCNVRHSVHVDKDLHDQKCLYLNTSPSLMTSNVCENVKKNHSRLHKASFFQINNVVNPMLVCYCCYTSNNNNRNF